MCDCSLDTDVRGRCMPGTRTWWCCPVKDDTLFFMISNDRHLYFSGKLAQINWLISKGATINGIREWLD